MSRVPLSPFAYVSFLRAGKRCRSNVVEREVAEAVAAHYKRLGFGGVEVVSS